MQKEEEAQRETQRKQQQEQKMVRRQQQEMEQNQKVNKASENDVIGNDNEEEGASESKPSSRYNLDDFNSHEQIEKQLQELRKTKRRQDRKADEFKRSLVTTNAGGSVFGAGMRGEFGESDLAALDLDKQAVDELSRVWETDCEHSNSLGDDAATTDGADNHGDRLERNIAQGTNQAKGKGGGKAGGGKAIGGGSKPPTKHLFPGEDGAAKTTHIDRNNISMASRNNICIASLRHIHTAGKHSHMATNRYGGKGQKGKSKAPGFLATNSRDFWEADTDMGAPKPY
jgi:hypothetical protein